MPRETHDRLLRDFRPLRRARDERVPQIVPAVRAPAVTPQTRQAFFQEPISSPISAL